MRIDNNFLIIISGDSTTYLLSSVYFKWNMYFQYFWLKSKFLTLHKVCKIIYFIFS